MKERGGSGIVLDTAEKRKAPEAGREAGGAGTSCREASQTRTAQAGRGRSGAPLLPERGSGKRAGITFQKETVGFTQEVLIIQELEL